MCAFHRTVRLEGRPGECAVAYFNASWIIGKYEIKHLCQWQRLECIVDGVLVDDIESPVWKIEMSTLNTSAHYNTISPLTVVTVECPVIQNTHSTYYYHNPSLNSCEPEFQLDLPIHLRYGAENTHLISPSPMLSLLSAVVMYMICLVVIITGKNKKCFVQTQNTKVS